jgi:hypothetical protein
VTDAQTSAARPALAVRRPRAVDGVAVEAERDTAHLEAVLASLRPGA